MAMPFPAMLHPRHRAVPAAPVAVRRPPLCVGVRVDLPVQAQFGRDHSRVVRATELGETGMRVDRQADDGRVRYLWLTFTVPGSNAEIRALGEVIPPMDEDRTTLIRWKHVFPDHQRALSRFVQAAG